MKYFSVVFVLLIVFSLNVFAVGQFAKVGQTQLYSEYYPNLHYSFNGTIVFENGSENSMQEWKSNKEFFQCARQYASLFFYDRNGLGKSPADLSTSFKNPITAKGNTRPRL